MDRETSDAVTQAIGYLATAGLAALAGALKYLQQFQAPGIPWSWKVFAIQTATAVLAGKIAEWLFGGWGANHSIVLAAVALAGWGGAQAIELARRKLGTKESAEGASAEN